MHAWPPLRTLWPTQTRSAGWSNMMGIPLQASQHSFDRQRSLLILKYTLGLAKRACVLHWGKAASRYLFWRLIPLRAKTSDMLKSICLILISPDISHRRSGGHHIHQIVSWSCRIQWVCPTFIECVCPIRIRINNTMYSQSSLTLCR